MRNALLRSVLPVAALALAAACIILPDVGDDEGWRTVPGSSSDSLEPSEVRQTAELAPGSTLTVENDVGDVEISGWDEQTAEIVARSDEGPSPRQTSARLPGRSGGRPNVLVQEIRNGLLVRAPTYEGPGLPPAVAYEIRVPADIVLAGIRIGEGNLRVSDVYGRIEASLERGNLTVINYSGIVEAGIGEGDADVEVLDLRETDSITITSGRGDIVLRLEPGVQAVVEADAPRGEVRSDFDLGVKLPARTAKGRIGQGGPNVILKASDGRIDIRAVR